jgi:hypothetical protein
MLPEERLDEAIKQIKLARESATFTAQERKWTADSIMALEACQSILEQTREQEDNAEVLEQ